MALEAALQERPQEALRGGRDLRRGGDLDDEGLSKPALAGLDARDGLLDGIFDPEPYLGALLAAFWPSRGASGTYF